MPSSAATVSVIVPTYLEAENVPVLVERLKTVAAAHALGARYVTGGTTHPGCGALARLNSWIARVIARPLIAVGDPMSGFFALRRSTFLAARALDPVGYKIALELIVKCECTGVHE